MRKPNFWKKNIRTIHWMSGAVCLIGMLLFAFTGITLNHAKDLRVEPKIVEQVKALPEPLRKVMSSGSLTGAAPLPAPVVNFLKSEMGVSLGGAVPEWSEADVYIGLPRPGGDAWLSIDKATGEVIYETTSRGWISYLNDLHKGRNTGGVWSVFLDVFSVGTIIFCLSGLWLMQIHANKRPSTWPLTGLGLVIPVLLLMLFLH